ncbi:MAG: hypothetical protein MRY32_05945 [Rickettsiales bacterium]|nr:hypothetical protein [Rickettsiales bacterium]
MATPDEELEIKLRHLGLREEGAASMMLQTSQYQQRLVSIHDEYKHIKDDPHYGPMVQRIVEQIQNVSFILNNPELMADNPDIRRRLEGSMNEAVARYDKGMIGITYEKLVGVTKAMFHDARELFNGPASLFNLEVAGYGRDRKMFNEAVAYEAAYKVVEQLKAVEDEKRGSKTIQEYYSQTAVEAAKLPFWKSAGYYIQAFFTTLFGDWGGDFFATVSAKAEEAISKINKSAERISNPGVEPFRDVMLEVNKRISDIEVGPAGEKKKIGTGMAAIFTGVNAGTGKFERPSLLLHPSHRTTRAHMDRAIENENESLMRELHKAGYNASPEQVVLATGAATAVLVVAAKKGGIPVLRMAASPLVGVAKGVGRFIGPFNANGAVWGKPLTWYKPVYGRAGLGNAGKLIKGSVVFQAIYAVGAGTYQRADAVHRINDMYNDYDPKTGAYRITTAEKEMLESMSMWYYYGRNADPTSLYEDVRQLMGKDFQQNGMIFEAAFKNLYLDAIPPKDRIRMYPLIQEVLGLNNEEFGYLLSGTANPSTANTPIDKRIAAIAASENITVKDLADSASVKKYATADTPFFVWLAEHRRAVNGYVGYAEKHGGPNPFEQNPHLDFYAAQFEWQVRKPFRKKNFEKFFDAAKATLADVKRNLKQPENTENAELIAQRDALEYFKKAFDKYYDGFGIDFDYVHPESMREMLAKVEKPHRAIIQAHYDEWLKLEVNAEFREQPNLASYVDKKSKEYLQKFETGVAGIVGRTFTIDEKKVKVTQQLLDKVYAEWSRGVKPDKDQFPLEYKVYAAIEGQRYSMPIGLTMARKDSVFMNAQFAADATQYGYTYEYLLERAMKQGMPMKEFHENLMAEIDRNISVFETRNAGRGSIERRLFSEALSPARINPHIWGGGDEFIPLATDERQRRVDERRQAVDKIFKHLDFYESEAYNFSYVAHFERSLLEVKGAKPEDVAAGVGTGHLRLALEHNESFKMWLDRNFDQLRKDRVLPTFNSMAIEVKDYKEALLELLSQSDRVVSEKGGNPDEQATKQVKQLVERYLNEFAQNPEYAKKLASHYNAQAEAVYLPIREILAELKVTNFNMDFTREAIMQSFVFANIAESGITKEQLMNGMSEKDATALWNMLQKAKEVKETYQASYGVMEDNKLRLTETEKADLQKFYKTLGEFVTVYNTDALKIISPNHTRKAELGEVRKVEVTGLALKPESTELAAAALMPDHALINVAGLDKTRLEITNATISGPLTITGGGAKDQPGVSAAV